MPLAIEEQRIHVLGDEVGNSTNDTVYIPSRFIAARHWQDLVDATTSDGHEYGYAVGIDEQANPVEKHLSGYPEAFTESGEMFARAGINHRAYPFGILRGRRVAYAAYVHTHPHKSNTSTGTFSNSDLAYFLRTKYLAMLMLDRGGAHLLAKEQSYCPERAKQLDRELFESTRVKSNKLRDLLKVIAGNLTQFGIGYYYTPDLIQPDEHIGFQNLTQRTADFTPQSYLPAV